MVASYLFRSFVFLRRYLFFEDSRTFHPKAVVSCTARRVEVSPLQSANRHPDPSLSCLIMVPQLLVVCSGLAPPNPVVCPSQISNSRSKLGF